MLFNSIDFALFLPLVFILYWFFFSRNIVLQNTLIVIASYVFYGWWDWRFLVLILLSTIVDYLVGLKLSVVEHHSKRKLYLCTSVCVNLGLLGFFKYYHFFLDNFIGAFSFFGMSLSESSLKVILPVGISFYTFQTLSYTIDVYKRKIEPTKNFIAFSAFVSFFPQLVAGPIERAAHLLPQFYQLRCFDYTKAVDGLRQMLWGLFKKVVIADNCAVYANLIFNDSEAYSGSTLLMGAFFFAFQIYGDFSGYSDIAIGTARLFGFNLMQNFAFPYFARDIAEFWRRWHISLTTWFRDYLYIPLGGSHGPKWMSIRNTFIVFLVSGFWHGANWSFMLWGVVHFLYYLPLLLAQKNRTNRSIVAKERYLPTFKEGYKMVFTFCLTLFSWIFFRAENIEHAFTMCSQIFSYSFFTLPRFSGWNHSLVVIAFIFGCMCIEWIGRTQPYALATFGLRWPRPLRWAFYSFILFLMGMFMPTIETPFIYFQF